MKPADATVAPVEHDLLVGMPYPGNPVRGSVPRQIEHVDISGLA
jgi:hypothetical protein